MLYFVEDPRLTPRERLRHPRRVTLGGTGLAAAIHGVRLTGPPSVYTRPVLRHHVMARQISPDQSAHHHLLREYR